MSKTINDKKTGTNKRATSKAHSKSSPAHREEGQDAPADILQERGPNGYPTGYSQDGDYVEWVPDDENPAERWPVVRRRGDKAIAEMTYELQEKIWWNRHQSLVHAVETGQESLTAGQKKSLEQAKKTAREIEKKYGLEALIMDDFEFGLLNGRYSALNWVQGIEWEASLDS